ncbi:hypothetical protein FACS189445_0110 [Spirochaetia bacterium]|nr:hypothetical protein FACS189445_0110 [Spirochaetia bacterium]
MVKKTVQLVFLLAAGIAVFMLSVFTACVSAPYAETDIDSYEPDSMDAPVKITNEDWVSRTLHTNDVDWFSFTPGSEGLLVAETDGDTDTVLELYRDTTLLRENDDVENNPNARIEYFVEPGVTYRIKASGVHLAGATENARGPYRFRVRLEPMPVDTAEPNDTPEQAMAIKAEDTIRGYFLTAEDVDWYTLTAPGPGRLTVYTTGTLDTLLEVYANGNLNEPIAEDDDNGYQGNAKLVANLQSAGPVYIKVHSYLGTMGRYYLHTQFKDPVKPDPFENDNSLSAAKDIQVGPSQERNFTDATDVDWVRLRITKQGAYAIGALAADNYLDTLIELFDANETLIARDDDSGGYWNALLNINLSPGTYYIKISTVDKDPLENNVYILNVSPGN